MSCLTYELNLFVWSEHIINSKLDNPEFQSESCDLARSSGRGVPLRCNKSIPTGLYCARLSFRSCHATSLHLPGLHSSALIQLASRTLIVAALSNGTINFF